MNWNAVSFDWNQVRAFLATVEEGSLSAAARALGLTQPTLSRQVACLEEDLGVVLFERGGRSMTLTQSGLELIDHVRAMGEAAMRVSLAASGQAQAIDGTVTITATDMLTTYVLPEVVTRIRAEAPGIHVVLRPSNEVRDLTKREADIAIRHAKPEQPDLIAKLVCTSSAHLYAAKAYLARQDQAIFAKNLSGVDFIGLDPIERFLPMLNAYGLSLVQEDFKATTTNGITLIELIRKGLGVSVIPAYIANMIPDLERVRPDFSIPVPIWLVTHQELRTSPRIRLVFDSLGVALENLAAGGC